MFEAVGHAVSRLIRIRYGAMVLPKGLKRGAWMELDEGDIQGLVKVAGIVKPALLDNPPGRVSRGDSSGRRRGVRGSGPRSSGSGLRSTGDTGPARGPSSAGDRGRGRGSRPPSDSQSGSANQPDPMKTAFGYIGADSFTKQRNSQPPGGGKGGPRRGGRGGN
jgi:23S rRNA pseudouridine2605 synthase